MSGYTMTISRREYQQRMRERAQAQAEARAAAESLARAEARSQELERRRKEAEAELSRRVQEISQARRETADLNRRFSEEIAQLDRQYRQQQAAAQQSLEDIRLGLGQLNMRMRRMGDQVQALSQDTAARFHELAAQKQSSRDMARMALDELQSQLTEMEGFSPRRFDPEGYAVLQQQLAAGEASLQAGSPEAALGVGNVCIPEAYALKGRVAVLHGQFSDTLFSLRREASALQAELETLPRREVSFELEGERITRPCDVDFWTHGAVTQLRQRFDGVMEVLNRAERDLSVGFPQLDQLAGELSAIRQEAEAAASLATEELLRSAAAMEEARNVDSVMTSCGWQREAADYCGGDEREDMSVIYSDGSGNTVVFRIGGQGDPKEPSVNFVVYDGEEDPSRAHETSQLVGGILDQQLGADPVREFDCRKLPTLEEFTRPLSGGQAKG